MSLKPWVEDHAAALNEIHRLNDVIERVIQVVYVEKPGVIRAWLEDELYGPAD